MSHLMPSLREETHALVPAMPGASDLLAKRYMGWLAASQDKSRMRASLMQTVSNVFLTGARVESVHVKVADAAGRERSFDYGLSRGLAGQPLVFVIPGFGCPYYEKTALFLSQMLTARGFHVATIHSPSHPKFLLNSHHSGVPGVTSEDSRDALMGIKAMRLQLRERGLQFSDTHIIGYSMGALNAAFAKHIDQKQDNLFKKTVLINPPIDINYGMGQLDSFLSARKMGKMAKGALIAKAVLLIVLLRRLKIGDSRQLKIFLSNSIMTESDLRALIGFNFEKTVAGGVSAAVSLGFLKSEEDVASFKHFCETATIAHYQNFKPGASTQDLFQSESLLRIGADLARDKNVSVMHNENDFLVRPRDLAWLTKEFGEQAHLFASGGHLGNIWRDEFQSQLARSLGVRH